MLTESMVLSLTAGLAGVVTARLGLPLVLRLVPAQVPRLTEVSVDWVVLSFALLVSTVTGIAFGLAPAVQSVKADLLASVRDGAGRSGTIAKTNRLRSLLIVSELALSVVLMVCAGLLLRTLWGLLQENPGFNPRRVVTAGVWLPVPNDPKADQYAKAEIKNNLVRESLRRVNALPGIDLAAMATDLPVTAGAFHTVFAVEDRPDESDQDLSAELTSVSPDFFRVMQVPLDHGRFFTEDDVPGKQLVAIVDETTARRFWPAQDAIGRRLKFSRTRNPLPWITVVGVISDVKSDGLDKDGVPHIYLPIYQSPARVLNVVARTTLPAAVLEPQIRHEIQAVDPGLPVFGVRAMNEVVDASLAPRRFSAELVGVFALLALLLASVGIYGLLAYMVSQRSQEIGIRMALGARPANIRKMVLGQGVVLAGIGVAVGILLAAATAPAISSLLYGVRALDPAVFLTVPLSLIVMALLASYVPAHRATRVDPMIALRHE
jgi:putative ABC transport system permease protein